jgi:hypothetical protein
MTIGIRWLAAGTAAAALLAGLSLRAYAGGAVAQAGGTALYATMVYAGVVLGRPGVSPVPAAGAAIAFCWAVEAFQLTGVPAQLSAHSLIARLVLGSRFDWADIAWYPAGVLPLAAVDLLVRRRLADSRRIEHRSAG